MLAFLSETFVKRMFTDFDFRNYNLTYISRVSDQVREELQVDVVVRLSRPGGHLNDVSVATSVVEWSCQSLQRISPVHPHVLILQENTVKINKCNLEN